MGLRGPQPLPAEELKLRGTYRADRHAGRGEDKPDDLCEKPERSPRTKCGDPGRWIRNQQDEKAIANGCYYDERLGSYVVEWFAKYLRHSKGEWGGQPFELQPWQRDDIIMPLFGWLRQDGRRRFTRTYIEIPKKNGKALATSTPIPTPDGWTTMGELQVGDTVFDDNGLPCRVVAATPVMSGRPCFIVGFSQGEPIVADAAHEWLTHSLRQERVGIRETQEIAETLKCGIAHNHRIPVAGPLHTPPAMLPVDPYVFGAWLGDGESASARLTCGNQDLELLDHIRAAGVSVDQRASSNAGSVLVVLGSGGRSQAARDSSMQSTLRRMGILRNKHVPPVYLRASITQRLALLQGLMDTDGYVSSKAGQCEFTTTNRAICDGVAELLQSLSFKPTVKADRAKIYGRDCGPKYRIQFWAFSDTPVFRLRRKLARLKPRPGRIPRSTSRHIIYAMPCDSVPVRCIQVDSPSRLFLAGRGMVPTHNSTLASGVGLYMLAGDGEHGPEVYSAATDKDQAAIVHGEAINMVETSPELNYVLRINRTTRNILYEDRRGYYRAVSAKPQGKEGFNGNCCIADELHAWYGDELWNALKYMGASRFSPLMFVITTAGDDMESICRKQHDYARSIEAGTISDDRVLVYIRGLDRGEDFTTPEARKKANPSLGITINEQAFVADMDEARQSPSSLASFLRYRFNVWATSTNPWLRLDDWQACGPRPMPIGSFGDPEQYGHFDEASMAGRECWAGLDLAKTRDLTSLTLMFPMDKGDEIRQLCWFWMPEDAAHKNKHLASFLHWAAEGWIRLTPGNVCDYNIVKADILAIAKQFRINEMAFDPYNAEQITQDIENEGSVARIAFPQTIVAFASPTSEYERLIMSGKLRHNNNPVLNWQAGHVQVRSDVNNNKRPVKPKHGDYRTIDGIVAGIMALARLMEGASGRSVYEDRGVLMV